MDFLAIPGNESIHFRTFYLLSVAHAGIIFATKRSNSKPASSTSEWPGRRRKAPPAATKLPSSPFTLGARGTKFLLRPPLKRTVARTGATGPRVPSSPPRPRDKSRPPAPAPTRRPGGAVPARRAARPGAGWRRGAGSGERGVGGVRARPASARPSPGPRAAHPAPAPPGGSRDLKWLWAPRGPPPPPPETQKSPRKERN